MIEIWANLGVVMFALLLAGLVWFIFFVIGKSIFEDLLGRIVQKLKRIKFKKDDDDPYVY